MNASMSRRQWLGLAAAASASAAIQRNVALGANLPPEPARLRLAVCIDALFTDAPFEERPAKVKAAGVNAFEFWGWRGRDMDSLARMREELGMEVIGIACDTGGPLVAPGGAQRIIAPLKDTLAAARQHGRHRHLALRCHQAPSPRPEHTGRTVELGEMPLRRRPLPEYDAGKLVGGAGWAAKTGQLSERSG